MNALSVLKSRTALFVAALAIGLSTTAAHAQYETDRAQFVAPFAFEYGSQHLPAGRYIVSRENTQVTLIRGDAKSVMALTQTTSDLDPTTRGKIVFRKYGQRLFLTQVWIPGKSSHLSCIQTKAERAALKEAKVALNGTEPSTVEVALLENPR